MTTISAEHQKQMQASRSASKSVAEMLAKAHLGFGPTQMRAIEQHLSQMPQRSRATYLRALAGKSRTAAIKAFCSECVGWQRKEVAGCISVACPLFQYRPFK